MKVYPKIENYIYKKICYKATTFFLPSSRSPFIVRIQRVPQNTYINANARKTFANPVLVLVLTELAMNLLAIKQLNTPAVLVTPRIEPARVEA